MVNDGDFFARGPYGEILPPNFAYGVNPHDAVEQLAQAVKAETGEDMDRPQHGKSGQGLLRIAAAFVHSQNLIRALRGELITTDALLIRVFVEQVGEPISLRPLYLDDLYHQTFVPVFAREGDDPTTWRIGRPGEGKTRLLKGDCPTAFAEAKRLYTQWAEEEESHFATWLKEKTGAVRDNVHVLMWALQLAAKQRATIMDGFNLEHWGSHSTYGLITPKGTRLLKASSDELAAKYTYVVLQKSLTRPPEPQEVIDAILTYIPAPQKANGNSLQWRVNGATLEIVNPNKTVMTYGTDKYEVNTRQHVTEVVKNGRRWREIEWPTNWTNEADRRRVLIPWCGLLIQS